MDPKPPAPPQLLYDGFDLLTGGMDSGIAPLSLPLTKIAYGFNTTVRGGYVTHRPPYSDLNFIFDTGISLTDQLFQCAAYYEPDFGAESIVALIGGRVYQIVPDTDGNAYVYDRTVRVYSNGIAFSTQSSSTTLSFGLTVVNLSDSSAASYPSGTNLTTDPSLVSISTSLLSIPPVLVNSNTQIQYTGNLQLEASYVGGAGLVGSQVYIGTDGGVSGQIKWNVIASGTSGGFPYITIQYTAPTGVSGGTITFASGQPVFHTVNPAPPQVIAVSSAAFGAPAIGSSVTIALTSAYAGSIGDNLSIGNGLYQVTAIPNPTNTTNTVTTEVQGAGNNTTLFTFDPNPANIRTAWMWQAEKWMIINDGVSRPIFFDGVSSRRSVTPTFIGTLAESLVIPQIGQAVNITLSSEFNDEVGTFLGLTPIGLFPFLMQVVATNVGGNADVVTAVNVTGQTSVTALLPIGTPINSTTSPSYNGVLASSITGAGVMPAPGGSLTIQVSPPYTGIVGDSIILTDGTGPLTSYTLTVTSILSGGNGLIVTNENAPAGLVVQVGYPIISSDQTANELPICRMGAYVEGRNWMSLPSGRAFIASDQVGDSSGTQAENDRDAVLKWSLNTTQFSVPGEAGKINCIVALSSLDASLGQGPLQVLCDNDIFTCAAPSSAPQWPTVTSPILSESAIGVGGTGQNAAAIINSDLIFKSSNGGIYSLKLVRQDFDEWADLPISQEMNRVLDQENPNLYSFLTADEVDNRCLFSCNPIEEDGLVYSQGFIARDDDVTSSLQGKLPPVYDGVWKGLKILQMVSGMFSGVQRSFVFCLDQTNTVKLVELLDKGSFDNGYQPIKWGFEGPVLFKTEGKFLPKRLEGGEIYISNLVGKAKIRVWYRPDFDQCWHEWETIQVCADDGPPQYRMRLGLGKPDTEDCDPTVNKKPCDGRFFQLRFEIEGSLTFMAAIAIASSQPQFLGGIFPPPPEPEGTI